MKLTEEAMKNGAAQAAEIFDRKEQTALVPFSPRFSYRRWRITRRQRRSWRMKKRLTAAACLIAMLGLLGLTETGQAALTAALRRITTIQEDNGTLHYRAVGEAPRDFIPMQPTAIPKRMTLIEQYDSETLRIREYSGVQEEYLRYEQEAAAGTRFHYETEEAEILTIGKDVQGLCLYDADFDQWTLIWLDETSRLILTGNLKREEMLAVAASVR